MKIQYLGHSCFYLITAHGIRIMTDPGFPGSGVLPGDIVLTSHDHQDHCSLEGVAGPSTVISGAGSRDTHGVEIFGFLGDHGTYQGKWLGMVVCYRLKADGLTLLHLSDVGVIPGDDEIRQFGPVDVLFIPVGGRFTLDGETASILTEKIKPAVVIPMHYAQAGMDRSRWPIDGVDPFISRMKKVIRHREQYLELTVENLPATTETIVMTVQ